jgi:hypothetical protein
MRGDKEAQNTAEAGKLVALTLFLRAPYSGRSLFEGTEIAR